MIKQLLSVAIMGGFALSAVASIPCPIKHNDDWNPAAEGDWCDGNGFWYEPSSSSSAAEALDPDYVVTCKWYDKSAYSYMPEVGFQWQTASIKATTDDLKITKDHVIFAFDYKTNVACNQMTIYFIYGGNLNGQYFSNGPVTTVSDEWQTAYVFAPIAGETPAGPGASTQGRPADFGVFEDPEHTGSDYMWPRFEDLLSGLYPEFEIQYKLPRWLTQAEAAAEIAAKNLSGDQDVQISTTLPNTDASIDYNDDGMPIFMTSGENPIINLFNPLVGPYAGNTTLEFEYQVAFGDDVESGNFNVIPMNTLYVVGQALAGANIASAPAMQVATMSADYLMDDEEWGKISIDFGEALASTDFKAYAIQPTGFWLQFRPDGGFPTESLFYIRNAKLVAGDNSGIENIAADNAEGVATYYNLQGVQVANPANGLYIKKQGNTTTKVLVK